MTSFGNSARSWSGVRACLTAGLLLCAALPLEAGTVTGTVKDATTNAAVSGVLVKVNQQTGKQATTNSSGVYSIPSVSAGSVTLALSKTGYVSATSSPITVPSSGTVTVPLILLTKLGTITGTVVNASSGAGVASATVTVTGTATAATTSSSGAFTLSVPAGTVTLTITKSGWQTSVVGPYTVASGGSVSTGAVPLVRYGVVTGRVRADADGSALSGATVALSGGGGSGTTDSTGAFSITCLPATYTATASKAGFAAVVSSAFSVTSGVTLTIPDMRLALVGTATGVVRNAVDATPLPGVRVAVFGGTDTTTTGADGTFAIPVAPASTSLVLSKVGFGTVRTSAFTVGPGETVDVGAFALDVAGVLTGTVVGAGTGTPLAGVLVSLQPPLETRLTDATGAFSFDLADGTYSLGLSKDGWVASSSGPHSVLHGQVTATGSLPLVAKGTVTGTVVRASGGTAVAGAVVRVIGASGTVTTDAAGRFAIGAAPGLALLAVSAPPLAPAMVGPVTVVSAQTVDAGTVSLVTAGTITGTVVAAQYGYAVSSALVTVPGTASESVTNSAGAFTLYVVPGTVSVSATKAGWSTATVGPFTVAASGTVATGAIQLTRWGVVTGMVLAGDDGSPIEGVSVTLSGGGGSGTTDATGTFVISCPPATYTATFSRAGFQTLTSSEFTTWSGVTLTLWDTSLARHGTATGLVTSSADGQPLPGVRVAVVGGSGSTVTGPDGRFAMTVPPDPSRLALSKAGFGTVQTGEFTVGIGEWTDVGPFSLGAGGVLSGLVVRAGTGAPLAGVLVSLQPMVETRLTDASGAFSFELAAGDYSVVLSRDGWETSTAGPFSVTVGATTTAGSLPLIEFGTIVGTVVRTPEGTPVGGAVVRVVGVSGTVTTDAAGRFSIKARPGAATLLIESPPYSATTAGPVTVVSAQTVDVGTVALRPPGTLRGTVVGGLSNTPVAGATVRVNGASNIATTDAAGVFSFQLPAGDVTLTISKSGFTTLTTGSVTVTSGATTDTGPLHLVQNGSVVGRVASAAGGLPLAGATVSLEDPRRTATTAADGTFVLTGIPAGMVGSTFAVTLDGFSSASAWPRLVFEGQATDLGTILLDPPEASTGTIHGTVVDDGTGAPVSGAAVRVWNSYGGTVVSGTTDAAGAFSFTVYPSTDLSIQATASGLASLPATGFATAGWTAKDVGALRLVPVGVISGRVLTTYTCTACAKNTDWCTRTTSGGAFSLLVPPGTWDVVAWYKPARPTTKGPVTVVAGETASVGDFSIYTTSLSVSGQAVGARSGVGVDHGSVVLSNSSQPAATVWSGQFSFIDVPPGSYAAKVSSPGWLPATGPSFTVVAGSSADAGTTVLERGGKVLGTVRDSLSGLPLANADVLVSGTGYSDRTDEYGGFLLSVPAGAHSLRIVKEGWQTTLAGPASVAVGSVVNLGYIPLVPESTAPGLVTGTVRTAQGPAVGSRVQALPGGASVLTDAQGGYSLGVPAGTVSIVASLDGWASAGRGGVAVLAGQTVPLADLTLSQPAATVSGRVLNMYGGSPIAGAVVTAEGTGVAGLTDATGAFSLVVPPGVALIRAVATGWAYTESGYNGDRRLALAPGQVASGIVLTLEPLSEVSGRVVDSVGGAPVAGALISTSASSTETDADGRFSTWEYAGPGGYCGMTKAGWSWSGDYFDVPLRQPVALGELRAAGTGTLVGLVQWDYKQLNPNEGATVVVEGLGGSFETSTGGAYSITVPPGTYTVRASRSSDYDTVTSAPVSVVSGETMEVERIYLAGYAAAYGTVRDAETQLPLEGVTVSALETGASTVSDSAGGFSLRLRVGTYTIVFTKQGYVTRTQTSVHLWAILGGAFIFGVDLTPESTFELAQLAIVPGYVRSFETATGTVIAKGPAPSGGATVTLTSDNPSAVTMPATVSFLEGASTASFPITGNYPPATQDVKITARHQKGYGWTETWAFMQVDSPPPIVLQGISPATALPGDDAVLAYVEGLSTAGYTVALAGPVYAFGNLSAPLCDLASGACPTQSLSVTLEPSGKAVRFALPVGLGEGYYAVRAVEATGRGTSWGWMGVESREKAFPVQTPEDHRSARRLLPGQVVTGTFAENGDPNGNLGDYNFFYFIAPAGSAVSVRLERVDTSLPWEAPSSLDPQLELVSPDGFIYANLRKFDDAAQTDLNATLTGAILPRGGLWLLAAETTRGSGAYRLTFNLAPAPPASGERAIPIAGNGNTLPLGVPLTSAAVVLDPRGYPLSGAGVTFVSSTAPENKGIVQFAAGNTVTSGPDGSTIVTATFTSPGKVSLTPTFSLPLFANLVADAPAMTAKTEIPLYEPVGRWPIAVRDFSEDTIELRPAARESGRAALRGLRGESNPERREGGVDATDAVPLPVPIDAAGKLAALDRISGCESGVFNNVGVTATEVHAPFTLTLKDLTPRPGEETAPGVLGTTEGIAGHRIETPVRLKLIVTDATGNEPNHPVLVQMAVGGPKAGKLILDPDGARIECESVSFLWHDRDAQGKLTEKNEDLEYRLGEYAPLVGFKPDEQTPGAVKPVWGVAEQLRIVLSAPDESGSETWERTLDVSFPVRPQPGKPDHFAAFDYNGDPCPDVFPFWTGYRLYQSGTRADNTPRLITEPFTIVNSYYLADVRGNTVWGYRNVSATDPSASLTVGFSHQETTGPDFAQYALSVSWTNDPAFPLGPIPANLSVQYPESTRTPPSPSGGLGDPGWPAGNVSKAITLDMQGGEARVLTRYKDYDGVKPDLITQPTPDPLPGATAVKDGAFPISVSPGSTDAVLPKTSADDVARLVLLTQTGNSITGLNSSPEPTPAGARVWHSSGTPDLWHAENVIAASEQRLETAAPGVFRLSLIDDYLKPVTDGEFIVHLCPRFEHWAGASACPTPESVTSVNGVVSSVTVNDGGLGRGYLGIELKKAPMAPGTYYVNVESLDGAYRIRRQSDFVTAMDPAAGENKGAFALCMVTGLQLLDEGFANVAKTLNVSVDRSVYLRERMSSEASADYRADVVLKNLDTLTEVSLQKVVFRRLGKSDIFQTDLISIVSPDPPLQPPNAGPEPRFSPLFLQRQAMAGTVTPTPGRHSVSRRREGGGESRAAFATTRLAEITFATPNFDGMSPGRGEIFANVRPGANGRVAVTMTNVNDPRIFTFDTWTESGTTTRLTTDLTQPLPVGQEQSVTRGQIATFPAAGEPSFRAIANPANDPNGTVNPGLYRLQAAWKGGTPLPADLGAGDFCDTEKEQYPVCRNEWIVSVGQRILVEVEEAAKPALAGYLTQVGDARSVDAFLQEAAAAITAKYTDAGANVVVSFKPESTPHPRLHHFLWRTLGDPEQELLVSLPYGGTDSNVPFPNTNPDRDLAAGQCDDQPCGVSLEALYRGWSRRASGPPYEKPYWVEHRPEVVSDVPPGSCGDPANPCPREILFNRFVNVLAHETAHGFGILSRKAFRRHGEDGTLQGMNWVKAWLGPNSAYREERPESVVAGQHEPIGPVFGFGQTSEQSNSWLMQYAMFRWRNRAWDDAGSYAQGDWLVFDRPLRFSLSSDYLNLGADLSIEQFLKEISPLCSQGASACR